MSDSRQCAHSEGKRLCETVKRIFLTDLPHTVAPATSDATLKESARNIPRLLAEIILVAYAVHNTYLVTDAASDSIKNTLFYKACIAIMLVVILAGRVNIISARLIPEAGFVYATYLIFKKVTGYTLENAGIEYYPSCVWKIIAWDIAVLLVLEIAVHKRIRSVKQTNWWFAGLVLASTIYFCVVDINCLNYLVLPVLVLYLIYLEKPEWLELCDALAGGFIAGGGFLFAKSFRDVPLAEDMWYKVEGTYFGNFLDTENSGALVGGMMICAVFFVATGFLCVKKAVGVIKIFFGLLVFALTVYISYLILNITGIAGAVLAITVIFLVYSFRKNRILGFSILLVGLSIMVAAGGYCWKASKEVAGIYCDTTRTETLNKFQTRVVVLQGGEFIDDKYVISDSDFVNALNRMSSGRIKIWKHYVPQINVWGENPIPDESGWSTHSAFLYWLIRFGLVGGSLFIARFFVCLSGSISGAVRNRQSGMDFVLLWMTFCFAFFIASATSLVWPCMCILFFVILQYPFLAKVN